MSLYRHYKFPWRQGNHFETLVDSTVFFPRMLDAIDSARQYVLLEMYLVSSGVIADRFIHTLLAAAERGVKIYMLLDDFGAQKLDQRDRKRLVHPNIQSSTTTRCILTALYITCTGSSGIALPTGYIATIESYCWLMTSLPTRAAPG